MKTTWNFSLLYKSIDDPKIEKDIEKIEEGIDVFSKRFDVEDKKYLRDKDALFLLLTEYENLEKRTVDLQPLNYLSCLIDTDSKNNKAISKISLFENRLVQAQNKMLFFEISLGTIDQAFREQILSDDRFKHYRFQLNKIFDDQKYTLSIKEEKIMGLKSLPSYDMWVMMNDRILSDIKIKWKNKLIPGSEALDLVQNLPKQKDRARLSLEINKEIKKMAPVAEAEINAIVTNKKINDSLRGYKEAFDATVQGYRNDKKTVLTLVNEVTNNFKISHKFYKIKSRLLNVKKMGYFDRGAPIGKISKKFDFVQSTKLLGNIFGSINPLYKKILDQYTDNGQIDVYPKVGKIGGAYCRGSYTEPTYVLLNHADDYRSFETYAHEMGHAFHTYLSRSQSPIYAGYSTVLAETASTLFENIALNSVYDSLSKKEKIIALHDKINGDIATIFRQIACFNFEKDIHDSVRAKGFLSKEELADMHNKHMQAYLGPSFELKQDDGLFFVNWSHIRRFFYVYSYAFGLLVSKALLRRYKQDPAFWTSIEKFLSTGGRDTPENILKDIGIDVTKPDFWKEGLLEIEEDIKTLDELTKSL
jgi:oligoendopeptidase F